MVHQLHFEGDFKLIFSSHNYDSNYKKVKLLKSVWKMHSFYSFNGFYTVNQSQIKHVRYDWRINNVCYLNWPCIILNIYF